MENKTQLTAETANNDKANVSGSIFKYLEIKSYEDGKVVKRLDVTGQSDRSIDRVERGMNINLNHEAFYTFSYDSEYKLDTI